MNEADKVVERLFSRYGSMDQMPEDARTIVGYYLAERRGVEREAKRLLLEAGRWL